MRQAEHGQDSIADVLLDLAAVARDLGRHGAEVAFLDFMQRLRIDALAERSRACEVGKHDGDGLANLLSRGRNLRCDERLATVPAPLELRWVVPVATLARDHGNKSTFKSAG